MILFNQYLKILSGPGLFTSCSVLIIILLQVRESNGNGNKFPPLPKPADYKLKPITNNNEESGLEKIAYEIANILRDKPPYRKSKNYF